MKAVTIRETQGQLGELIAQACRGELIVLTDGDRQVALEPRALPDLEEEPGIGGGAVAGGQGAAYPVFGR
jgi:hypothetical protein